jgi:hypothetical protein
MPRYIGERRGEMYYKRDGKWHHCRDNGRCFDSMESAQRDFNKVCPKAPADDFLAVLFVFLVISLCLKLIGGVYGIYCN